MTSPRNLLDFTPITYHRHVWSFGRAPQRHDPHVGMETVNSSRYGGQWSSGILDQEWESVTNEREWEKERNSRRMKRLGNAAKAKGEEICGNSRITRGTLAPGFPGNATALNWFLLWSLERASYQKTPPIGISDWGAVGRFSSYRSLFPDLSHWPVQVGCLWIRSLSKATPGYFHDAKVQRCLCASSLSGWIWKGCSVVVS